MIVGRLIVALYLTPELGSAEVNSSSLTFKVVEGTAKNAATSQAVKAVLGNSSKWAGCFNNSLSRLGALI